jgi:predicted dithiol-disulfide oxidoreductase (DUF899 family)
MSEIPHPPIATRDEWAKARQELLLAEKELTRQRDRINAARRRLPNVIALESPVDYELVARVQAILAPIRDVSWQTGRPENN